MPLRLTLLPHGRTPWHEVLWEKNGVVKIGRGSEADVQVDDPQLSRIHASVSAADGWRIRDEGSANGLFVNGLRVEESPIDGTLELFLGTLVVRAAVVSTAELDRAERDRLENFRESLRLVQRTRESGSAELLDRLLRTCATVCGATRGFVLIGPEPDDLSMRASLNMESKELGGQDFSGSRGAVREALRTGAPIVVADTSQDVGFSQRKSVATGGIRCLICLPLVDLSEEKGVIYLDSQDPGTIFDTLDVEFLESIASHASLALEVQRLRRDVRGARSRAADDRSTAVDQSGAPSSELSSDAVARSPTTV